MARFTDEQINRLKTETSLQRLVESYGIALKKHGKDLIGLCPFHDDREPSLVISPDKNLWHCLGACQMGGSVIDWVMKAEGVSFKHAVELLQNDYHPSAAKDPKPAAGALSPGAPAYRPSLDITGALPPGAPAYRPSLDIKRSTVTKLDNPFDTNIEDQQLLNRVIDYYHQTLKQNPDALAYCQKRGITAEAIDHFKIGVANRTLGYRLPKANRKDGAVIREQLQRIGLYRKSGHEHFSGSLVIPVMSRAGRYGEGRSRLPVSRDTSTSVCGVYGRKILGSRLRKGTPQHLYLPGSHKGIFNLAAVQNSSEIILCESLIDALSFWCNGYRNVTSSYGIEGFTHEHLVAFKENNITRVLIAYDRDSAGDNAALKLSKQLIKEGIDCYRIQFPKGMDANEYVMCRDAQMPRGQEVQERPLSVSPASKALGVVIRSAVWLGAGALPPGAPAYRPSLDIKAETNTTELVNDESAKKNNAAQLDASVAESETVINEVLPASPIPEAPQEHINADINDNDITIHSEDRRYRVRGLNKNLSYDVLKINLLVSQGDKLHIDTFDLYQSRPRTSFIKQASIELGVNEESIKSDLGKVLLKCEALQEARIKQTQTPKANETQLSDKEQKEAVRLLKSKHLLKRIQKDFNNCGIVGENTNTLVGYLASVSRKLDNPLAVIIQSTSAAGKSSLMEAVLRFIPDDDKHQYSAMTGQSLYYLGESNLKHKVLAIAEEEGAAQAAYALKLLQSEGQLTIASTSKDPDSGDLVTKEYKVEGPVMLFLTTTAIDIDDELLNRCLVLTVNEEREQTEAIHQLQRKKRTLEGLIQKSERKQLLKQHQNAQRLLKPLAVVNPYAEQLTFLNNQTRTRRDHEKYLTLIDSIALLHQYQREIKTISHNNQALQYIEVTLSDIEAANTLAHEVLGRTLDELPPQTRKLLTELKAMVDCECQRQAIKQRDYRFKRREIRKAIGWTDFQVRTHIHRLIEMEYVLIHRGGRGQSFVYELLYDGEDDKQQPHLNGLIDIKRLKQHYDDKIEGQNNDNEGSLSPQRASIDGAVSTTKTSRKANNNQACSDIDNDSDENTYIKGHHTDASYSQASLVAASK